MITEAVPTARSAGCTGTLVVRMDSAFYGSPAIWAARRAGARFSVTARADPKVRAAIAAIPEDAWVPIATPIRGAAWAFLTGLSPWDGNAAKLNPWLSIAKWRSLR